MAANAPSTFPGPMSRGSISSALPRCTLRSIPLDPHVASGSILLPMKPDALYRIQQVARLTGVSVRALHHYDDIGLLRPAERSAAGYRLYSQEDMFRLQQILIGRELGLSLEAIRRSLDDPKFDRRKALLEQR